MKDKEKAKRYDEAIERANNLHKDAVEMENNMTTKTCEIIFPELKESEDERIRKALKEYFINSFQNNGVAAICGVHIKDILAWLEKQGEQRSDDIDNKFIRMRETKPANIAEFLDRLTTVEQEFLWEHIAKIRELDKEEQKLENQSEKKPAKQPYNDELEEEIEEWLGCEAFPEGTNITPLPKAMDIVRETANHFYDFGRKQQATRNIQCTNSQVITPESYINEGQKKGIQKVLDNPQEYGLQKITEWSKEDKEFMERSISNLTELEQRFGEDYGMVGKCINWIKSLKDRVQPKQEWSEEDEYYRNIILFILNNECVGATDKENAINWFKSIKPHSQWKPSEHELEVLKLVAEKDGTCLMGLYKNLKKLREG